MHTQTGYKLKQPFAKTIGRLPEFRHFFSNSTLSCKCQIIGFKLKRDAEVNFCPPNNYFPRFFAGFSYSFRALNKILLRTRRAPSRKIPSEGAISSPFNTAFFLFGRSISEKVVSGKVMSKKLTVSPEEQNRKMSDRRNRPSSVKGSKYDMCQRKAVRIL